MATAATAVMKGPVGTLTTATYSTCPPGQRQWEFSAGRISVDDKTATGVAHNVTLRLGGIPGALAAGDQLSDRRQASHRPAVAHHRP